MKHKTWFRLVLKAMGVFFAAQGVVYLLSSLPAMALAAWGWFVNGYYAGDWSMFLWEISGALIGAPMLLVGFYLFYRGEWIVSEAIPSNRPYCPDCGYDLSTIVSTVCPECGAALPTRPATSASPPGDS